MALADRRGGERGACEARATDALAIGCAQAVALVPGVSRSGAALAAARLRGFDRAAAQELSWGAALPVTLGAATLSAVQTRASSLPAGAAPMLAAGAAARSPLTLAATHWAARSYPRPQRLAGFAIYRLALSAAVLARVARGRRRRGHRPPQGHSHWRAAARRSRRARQARCAHNYSRMAVIGSLLGGRYRLERQIGRGGMSTVYRAFDTVLERQVAIKVMHREIAATPTTSSAFAGRRARWRSSTTRTSSR